MFFISLSKRECFNHYGSLKGIAPTVMVASVAAASHETVVHANSEGLSDLEFQARSRGLPTSCISGECLQPGDSSAESRSSGDDEKRETNDASTKEI